jgi:hypothetical protein
VVGGLTEKVRYGGWMGFVLSGWVIVATFSSFLCLFFFFVCLNHALCIYHSLTRVVYSITHMSHVFIFNHQSP